MTKISELIENILPSIPFRTEEGVRSYMGRLSVEDQAALVTALYVGRDHIHHDLLIENYVPDDVPFDRYFITGGNPDWMIAPSDFARIMFEKNSSLNSYYSAFVRCTQASGCHLNNF